jgi:hypothetical protein
MTMRMLPSCIVALAFFALPCRAAAPSQESVEKLLVLSKTEKLRETLISEIDQSMTLTLRRVLQNQPLSAADQRAVDAFGAKMTAAVNDELSWPMLKAVYVRAYTKTFTQEEIDGLIAFYGSPAGEAFAEKQPLVVQDTSLLLRKRMGELVAKMQIAMQDTLKDLRVAHAAERQQLSAPNPGTSH